MQKGIKVVGHHCSHFPNTTSTLSSREDTNHSTWIPFRAYILSSPFAPPTHKPSHQLRRRLLLPLPTAHPQRSVERCHSRLRRSQRRQLLVRAALCRRRATSVAAAATAAGTAAAAVHTHAHMMMKVVVVVVEVVIVQGQLAEAMMVTREGMVVERDLGLGRGWKLLQLRRVLNNVVLLLEGLLRRRQVCVMGKKRERSGLRLELEQILVMVMGM